MYDTRIDYSDVIMVEHVAITAGGRRSMLKLAQRMTDNFCAGVCASTVHKWNKLNAGNVDEDVRVMTRKSVDDHFYFIVTIFFSVTVPQYQTGP